MDVLDLQERVRFEQLVLPHVDAAFNLARWVLRGRNDAEDVAQEALLRAYPIFPRISMVPTRARGCCKSSATPATAGWRKIAPWNSRPNSTKSFIRNRARRQNRWQSPGRQSRTTDTRAGKFASAISRSSRAARTGRMLVQGDCNDHVDADRQRDVGAFAGASAVATIADATSQRRIWRPT